MPRPTARADSNRSAVLAHLGAHGPTSRADLARELGVSPALITQLSRNLLADNLIRELEHSASQGGRPARLLGIVDAGARTIGVKIAPDHVTLVEVSIAGEILRSTTQPFDTTTPTALTDLSRLLGTFLVPTKGHLVLGVGVGVPGSVDDQGEGIVDASQLSWSAVPVGPTLRREHGLPVLIENNVNALTLAQMLFGQARGHSSVLIATLGTGIGAGIVMNGVIARGATGSAGHIGHIPVDLGDQSSPRCQCGNTGCLEAFVGEQAIVRAAVEAGVVEAGAPIGDVLQAAGSGSEAALQIYRRAGTLLGRVLAGVVNTIDPEAIILLGEGVEGWRFWEQSFEQAFRASLIPHLRGVGVTVESWNDDLWALGAACVVLATPYDTEGLSGEQGRLVRERLGAVSA